MKLFKSSLKSLLVMVSSFAFLAACQSEEKSAETNPSTSPKEIISETETSEPEIKHATITANGDHLYHDVLYMSALDPVTGIYDFSGIYAETSEITQAADLAIGNFEGTMSPDYPLGGYPLFNAPPELAVALRDAGYDLMAFANNHTADSRGEGILSTVDILANQGVDTFGIDLPGKEFIVTKDVNGIIFSFLNYSYGFNGMDAALSPEEQEWLSYLDPEKIKSDIETAQEISDIVMVFPHAGVEYALYPTAEHVALYRDMVDWGADLVLGNHPHVLQPIEIYDDAFIIYSMGNFISNQRIETGFDHYWPERGVILEFDFEKVGDEEAQLVDYTLHPTWVNRVPNGRYSPEGYTLYDYEVLIAERHLDDERIHQAYHEIMEHLEGGLPEGMGY